MTIATFIQFSCKGSTPAVNRRLVMW